MLILINLEQVLIVHLQKHAEQQCRCRAAAARCCAQ
jgi:hypothetical protein